MGDLAERIGGLECDILEGEEDSYGIDGRIPRLVVAPKSIDSLREVVAMAGREGLAVAPIGSGTKAHIGNPPRRLDMVILTRHFDRILEYEPADQTMVVQAGARLSDVQEVLRRKGQFIPIDPPYYDRATLGGIVATNYNGPRRLLYGGVRDLVLGIKVVYPDGTIAKAGGKVVKTAAGYDLRKLHIGAFGTLGLILELSFKLYPIPEEEASICACFDGIDGAFKAVKVITLSPLIPSSIEIFDPEALSYLSEKSGVGLGDAKHALVIRFEGLGVDVERCLRDSGGMLKGAGGTGIEEVKGSEHVRLWEAIRELQAMGASDGYSILKLSYPIATVVDAFKALEGSGVMGYAHAGSGIHYLLVEPSGVLSLVKMLRSKFSSKEFYCVVEHAPMDVKERLDVWGYSRPDLEVMKAIKEAYDPKAVFNPGRFVGGI